MQWAGSCRKSQIANRNFNHSSVLGVGRNMMNHVPTSWRRGDIFNLKNRKSQIANRKFIVNSPHPIGIYYIIYNIIYNLFIIIVLRHNTVAWLIILRHTILTHRNGWNCDLRFATCDRNVSIAFQQDEQRRKISRLFIHETKTTSRIPHLYSL